MTNALTRYAPEFLPVLQGRNEPPPARPPVAADQRRDEFRAEPPRTEVRFSSRFEKNNSGAAGQSSFATQQIAQDDTASAFRLAGRKPLIAGYAAYADTARQTDPARPRPGRTLDRSA